MVFLTVGSSHLNFTRLIEAVDELAGSGVLQDVFAQIGNCDYVPRHCRWERHLSYELFQKNMREADYVICHGGDGTLEEGMRLQKKMIVVPRRVQHEEAPDDHQLEIVELLATKNRILGALKMEDLAVCIQRVPTWTPSPVSPRAGNPVADYINDLIRREYT